ncbi:MAG: hypothetical protein AAGF85_05855 [Bacteroidota bacterium]
MKKIRKLADKFNITLSKHEFLLKLNGDNELIITGAPVNNLPSRLFFSFIGIILVTVCLITGIEDGNTLIIGGCLLGLILTATPFISFYSKKSFKVYISKRIKQVNIDHGTFNPYTRMDFSSIEGIRVNKSEMADFASSDPKTPTIYSYSFCAVINGVDKILLSITTSDASISDFATEFGTFLSGFIEKPLK